VIDITSAVETIFGNCSPLIVRKLQNQNSGTDCLEGDYGMQIVECRV